MATGRIKRWNAEQGFGFIHTDEVSEDIFAHISDFKDKDLAPSVGDDVSFDIKHTKKGLQAKKIHYPNRLTRPLTTTATPHPRNQNTNSIFASLIKLIIVGAVAAGGYYAFQQYQATQQLAELSKPVYSTNIKNGSTVPQPATTITTANENFKCDGRQYCTQMTSLAEAKYFIAHCPDTKMDGNHDGEPCENDSRFH